MRQVRTETVEPVLRLDERTVVAIVRRMDDVYFHPRESGLIRGFFDHVCQPPQIGPTFTRPCQLLARNTQAVAILNCHDNAQ